MSPSSPASQSSSGGTVIVRDEALALLAPLAVYVADRRAESADATLTGPVVPVGFAGECVQCGMTLSEAEFLALATVSAPEASDPRLARVRLGYCGRKGCDSHYYRLTLKAGAGFDWFEALGAVHGATGEAAMAEEDPAVVERRAAFHAKLRRAVLRLGLGVAAVGVLLVARHWYLGGSVPILREPEDFVVDRYPVAPDSGTK